jgi:hypothetical protein
MKLAITAALLLGASTLPALTQEHPPTDRMDKAVPQMKSDTKNQQPPTKGVGEAVPEMKAGGAGKMSQDDCQKTWKQANPSAAATITMAQAQPYVSNFKAADPDSDGTLDQNEFMQACSTGGVTIGTTK